MKFGSNGIILVIRFYFGKHFILNVTITILNRLFLKIVKIICDTFIKTGLDKN